MPARQPICSYILSKNEPRVLKNCCYKKISVLQTESAVSQ